MFTISLHNLLFFAHHGVHEEERILGNNFIVNVSLTFKVEGPITSLDQTINYASVYQLVKERMSVPTALLETLAQELISEIHAFDNHIQSITVSIDKKDPPISNMQGSVGVSLSKDF